MTDDNINFSDILTDKPRKQSPNLPPYNNIPLTKHDCIQEERLQKLEKQQAEDMKNISKKLNLIWTAINSGDKDNLKMLLQVVGIFVGALVAVTLGFVAIIKLL